ncbi:MAG: hypothetical protein ACK52I_16700 [Pseudomonadota bacterium]
MTRRPKRERIAIPVAAAGTAAPEPQAAFSPLEEAVRQVREEAQKRDPILDDAQVVFSTPEGERILRWLQEKTLGQQVRLLTTASMNREAATDFAIFREGQNSMVLALMNLVRVANEEPPLSRTGSILF